MYKRVIIIGLGVPAAVGLIAGAVYAWNVKNSDVGKPVRTPESNAVRYHVMGSSMDPTIMDGDWLLAKTDRRTYERGDIVILRLPSDKDKVYCRRVVAIAGDRVVMRYYSDVKVTTVYTAANPSGTIFPEGAKPSGNAYGEYEATVGEHQLYVVGDNAVPGGSYDSDEWGLLPTGNVAGVITKRINPHPRSF